MSAAAAYPCTSVLYTHVRLPHPPAAKHQALAGVPGGAAVSALLFQVLEERADQRGAEVGEVGACWVFAGLVTGESEE
jgi:hypothetical protein